METFLLSFSVFCLAILGMAVGALAGRRDLEGGCGGRDGDQSGCRVCGVEDQDGETGASGTGRPAADLS